MRWGPLTALLLGGCGPLTLGRDAGSSSGAADAGPPPIAQRALTLRPCRGAAGVPDLSGVWAFQVESATFVEDDRLPDAQGEIVTRHGVVELCQDGDSVRGRLLVCALRQSPILDPAGDCAAQAPSARLVEALPEAELYGELARLGPTASLVARGWRERWGLKPGADLAEAARTVPAGWLVDQDADGQAGVTLRGDGEIPSTVWAARDTQIVLLLEGDGLRLKGITRGLTTQVLVGGPASRALGPRRRRRADGHARLGRVDGRDGSPVADADHDGRVSCGELMQMVGSAVPEARDFGCPREP